MQLFSEFPLGKKTKMVADYLEQIGYQVCNPLVMRVSAWSAKWGIHVRPPSDLFQYLV